MNCEGWFWKLRLFEEKSICAFVRGHLLLEKQRERKFVCVCVCWQLMTVSQHRTQTFRLIQKQNQFKEMRKCHFGTSTEWTIWENNITTYFFHFLSFVKQFRQTLREIKRKRRIFELHFKKSICKGSGKCEQQMYDQTNEMKWNSKNILWMFVLCVMIHSRASMRIFFMSLTTHTLRLYWIARSMTKYQIHLRIWCKFVSANFKPQK